MVRAHRLPDLEARSSSTIKEHRALEAVKEYADQVHSHDVNSSRSKRLIECSEQEVLRKRAFAGEGEIVLPFYFNSSICGSSQERNIGFNTSFTAKLEERLNESEWNDCIRSLNDGFASDLGMIMHMWWTPLPFFLFVGALVEAAVAASPCCTFELIPPAASLGLFALLGLITCLILLCVVRSSISFDIQRITVQCTVLSEKFRERGVLFRVLNVADRGTHLGARTLGFTHALIISFHQQGVNLRIQYLPTNQVSAMDEMHWRRVQDHPAYTQLVVTNPRAPRRDVPAGTIFTYGAGLLPPMPAHPIFDRGNRAVQLLLGDTGVDLETPYLHAVEERNGILQQGPPDGWCECMQKDLALGVQIGNDPSNAAGTHTRLDSLLFFNRRYDQCNLCRRCIWAPQQEADTAATQHPAHMHKNHTVGRV
mmetsp:Transcript_46435/g.68213  ORF Transcript_46435/g.68213 Transcript_46435/m.68213 type:complete len:424 (+) Transcript_46435:49-1320(+)